MDARPPAPDRDANRAPAGSGTELVTQSASPVVQCEVRLGALGQTRCEFRPALAQPVELTDIRQAEKVGNDRLTAPILVGAVGMQAVATAAGVDVDQGHR